MNIFVGKKKKESFMNLNKYSLIFKVIVHIGMYI